MYLHNTKELGSLESPLPNNEIPLYQKLQAALVSGEWYLALTLAVLSGNRDANQLTNMIFFARYPERRERKLERNEPNFKQLSQEWLDIRNRLVLPNLAKLLSQKPVAEQAVCTAYQPNEIKISRTQKGHLTTDVSLINGRLFIADFGVNWRSIKESTKNEKLLKEWLHTFEIEPTYQLTITGYSDCIGSEKNNSYLRSERARRVYELLGPGAQSRVKSSGPASSNTYVTTNNTVEGRAMNRGVIIDFYQTKSLAKPQVVLPTPCPPPTCSPVGSFLPSKHGYKFGNYFSKTIKLLPKITVSPSFGLCGGLATAALDYFLSCIPIPSTAATPKWGSTLFKYLLQRQIDSLGPLTIKSINYPIPISISIPSTKMIDKFMEWSNRPNSRYISSGGRFTPRKVWINGLQELTVPEFQATVKSLRAGHPKVLGLIRVGPGSVSIWDNHQVLAYGLSHVRGRGLAAITDIKVYDPNYPGNDNIVIRCAYVTGSWDRIQCEQIPAPNGERVRGFFRMPYKPKTPPCLP